MLKPYETMSILYDALTDNIDYETWFSYITGILAEQNVKVFKILEIGAGTGNMTQRFIKAGYKVTVIDRSEAMLSVLQEKMIDNMKALKFFNGDILTFKTVQKYDAIFGILDVLNYIKPIDLEPFFSRLHSLISPEGYVFLDWSTAFKFKDVIGESTFAEDHDEFSFIWENSYDENQRVLTFDFIMFTENDQGTYDKSVEHHTQYAHDYSTLEKSFSAYFNCVGYYGENFFDIEKDDHRRHIVLKAVK